MNNKASVFFVIFTSFVFIGVSQNLVLNPDFESVNIANLECSWYTSKAQFSAAISNWTCPTEGSTDIFSTTLANSCFCSAFSTHASAKGPQAPRSGNTYIPIVVYGSGGCTPYREYLQGQLSSSLVPGLEYSIEFYVSMADYNRYATNNIGVYFTTTPINNGSMCVYSVTPHVNYSGAPITDYTGWTLLSFTFIPTQAYSYFTIGNFYNDASTSTTLMPGSLTTCRYYIDDVSIELSSPTPIEMQEFGVICNDKNTRLYWATASEMNNDYFSLERSFNGLNFETIAQIEGAGTSNELIKYIYDDEQFPSTVYYRLKQTDYDGTSTTSDVISATCGHMADYSMTIADHSEDGYIEIFHDAVANTSYVMTITDAQGRIIQSKQYITEEMFANHSIDTRNMAAGIYVVNVISSVNNHTQKVMIR